MKRYPGIRPFRSDEQHLFFGRDTDTERLLRLIDLQQVVILYGKSGYGKSSLLSAGVLPRLQADAQLQPWEIRLGPYKPGESLPPAENLRLAIGRRVSDHPILPSSLAEPSLWQSLKNLQTPTNKRFLLVFDQFEELFTYPPEQVLEFKKQLAEALFSIVPRRYEKALASANLPPEAEDAIYSPFELKVVFSIRADRMSLLNGLKDYLPNLLQHGYELDALDEASAKEAILRPAKLPNIEFETPPFGFTPEALSAIFTSLSDEQKRIETSTLQIVCKHIEDNIVHGWMSSGKRAEDASAQVMGQRTVTAADLGDISLIFSDFYENTIAGLTPDERNPARHLIEDVLIKDGIRLPFAEQALLAQPGVTTDLLQRLAAASLLRVERDDQGRMLYEVGHDTLVRPIEEAAKARREAEKREDLAAEAQREKEAEELRLKIEAERQLQERKKIEAGRRRNILVGLFAFALLAFAFYQTWVASKAKDEAGVEKMKAEKMTRLAEENEGVAKTNIARADTLLNSVNIAKAKIDLAEKSLKLAKNATEAQTRLALQNLEEAERMGETVVFQLISTAKEQIRQLNHPAAAGTLENARLLLAGRENSRLLGPLLPLVAQAIMEPAFFYVESDQYGQARSEIAKASLLLDKPLPALRDLPWTTKPDPDIRARLTEMLRSLDPKRYAELQNRYYGAFVDVPGGTFNMGSETGEDYEKPVHEATLSPFKMAATETTWWQYHLFCAATGYSQPEKPGWGGDGDNPVVNVNWYDAVLYANWCSVQQGLQPAYSIDSLNKDPNNQNGSYDIKWTVTPLPKANGYRLPTEAEWEYAALAAGKENFEYAGDSLRQNVGWYSDNSGSRTHAVANKKPNGLGLYDMSGNVWEWCWDWYDEKYYSESDGTQNPSGPASGEYRVLRGGSSFVSPENCRVASRNGDYPYDRNDTFGFRVVRGY